MGDASSFDPKVEGLNSSYVLTVLTNMISRKPVSVISSGDGFAICHIRNASLEV